MTKHTPSTTDIRIRYERYREQEQQRGADGVTPVTAGEFERWYAAELAAAKAEAWDEATRNALEAIEDCVDSWGNLYRISYMDRLDHELDCNPYRTERTTDER